MWNRQDRGDKRLFPCWIMVANKPFEKNFTLDQAKEHAIDSRRFELVRRRCEWGVPKDQELFGRYVRVQLEGTNFLHFAELEVFHRVDFEKRNAQRLYSYDNADEPDYQPNEVREHYSTCHDQDGSDLVHEVRWIVYSN